MAISLWEYVHRYRNRIAAGATVVGGIYVAKKIWESDVLAELLRSLQAHTAIHSAHIAAASTTEVVVDGHGLRRGEPRRNFLFDAHQRSCDKLLKRILPSVEQRINERFNTEELIEKLKASGVLGVEEKLAAWECLRDRSICKLLAVAYAYPLLAVAFKSQRSIVCSEICRQMDVAQRERETAVTSAHQQSLAAQALSRLTALFWKPESEELDADNRVGRDCASSKLELDARTQQLFNNCTHYLMTEGLEQLFSLIEIVAQPILNNILLSRSLTQREVRELLERIGEGIDCRLFSDGNQKLRELIVPVRTSTVGERTYLQELLSRMASAIGSQQCRLLLSCLTIKYLDDYTQTEAKKNIDSMPMAKHVPGLLSAVGRIQILVETCGRIAKTKTDSVFQRTLILPELFNFTSMTFNSDALHFPAEEDNDE